MRSLYICFNCLCRAISTLHAIFITSISLYFVFWSDLFSDHQFAGLITLRCSQLSTFALGVSMPEVTIVIIAADVGGVMNIMLVCFL
jgi:hypothetical protein